MECIIPSLKLPIYPVPPNPRIPYIFYLCGSAHSGHFMEPYNMWPFVTGSFHLAKWRTFEGNLSKVSS